MGSAHGTGGAGGEFGSPGLPARAPTSAEHFAKMLVTMPADFGCETSTNSTEAVCVSRPLISTLRRTCATSTPFSAAGRRPWVARTSEKYASARKSERAGRSASWQRSWRRCRFFLRAIHRDGAPARPRPPADDWCTQCAPRTHDDAHSVRLGSRMYVCNIDRKRLASPA